MTVSQLGGKKCPRRRSERNALEEDILYFRAERNNGNTHAWINARNTQGMNEYLSIKRKGYIHPIQLCQNTPSTVSLLPPPISLLTYPTIEVFSGNANELAILGARNTYQSFYSHCQSLYSLLDLMAVVHSPSSYFSSYDSIPFDSASHASSGVSTILSKD